MLSPGMLNITNGLPKNLGDTFSDIGDTLGIGNSRREREFNAEQAALNRDFQSKEAKIQRNWEEKMSNTAYQRALNDMQAAGINPAMAFSNGANSASTPNGAYASGSQASSHAGGGNGLAAIINSAANLSYSFNSDKNSSNDMNNKNMIKTIMQLTKIMGGN